MAITACTMAPTGFNMLTSLVTACLTILTITQSRIPSMTFCFISAAFSLIISHSAIGPSRMMRLTTSEVFSSPATTFSPTFLTSFWRILAQVRPRICNTSDRMPRRSNLSGRVMPASPSEPVSHSTSPCSRYFLMRVTKPWIPAPTALAMFLKN